MSKDKALIGAAGEYLVLSRLLSREVLASLAPQGTRVADILVNPLDKGVPLLVQVKTNVQKGSNPSWPMNIKHESATANNLFYCFVQMPPDENPLIYVIPAKKVVEVVKNSHSDWLSGEGKKGQARKDTDMRHIKNKYSHQVKGAPDGWMDKYLEDWTPFE